MLQDFFKLNAPYDRFETADQLIDHFRRSDDLRNIWYVPDELSPDRPQNTFRDKHFTNVSFTKTVIRRVTFTRCTFTDCLFIGTAFQNCEFHDCIFIDCNPYKCSFTRTYLDPASFARMLSRKTHSNIGVYLFSQLLFNSAEMHQHDFEATADYHFRRWRRFQLVYDYRRKKMSAFQFVKRWVPDMMYFAFAGYGYRGSFFACWTLALFVILVAINHRFVTDFSVNGMSHEQSNSLIYSLYQTITNLTALGSNAIPATYRGMVLLALESLVGVVWLATLASIIVRKVVR